jgi:DNA polymerase-3 subunit beta
MKIHIQKELFEENLSTSSRFISSKISSIQSIQGARLTTQKDKVFLTTTSLNDFYHVEIPAKVEVEGDIVFDLKKTIEFISLLGVGDIALVVDGGSLVVSQGKNKGYFNMYSVEDFPQLPEVEGKQLEISKDVVEKLNNVLFSASKEETRPVLTGIFFGSKGGNAEIVSTDGFRLSLLRPEKNKTDFPGIIIPSHVLSEVVRQSKKSEAIIATVSDTEKILRFSQGNATIYSRVIEGEFPPYEKVIPKGHTTLLVVEKDEFLRNIKLVSVFAREHGDIILFDIKKEGLTLRPKTTQGDDSQVFMEHVEFEGEELKIAFNYRYVLDFLNTVSLEKLTIELTTPTAPAVFRDPKSEAYLHIIMPLRTEETSG